MPEAKKAETTLNTTAEPFKKELQRMNQDLQKSIATYGQAREGMSKQARDLKEKDLNLKAQGDGRNTSRKNSAVAVLYRKKSRR